MNAAGAAKSRSPPSSRHYNWNCERHGNSCSSCRHFKSWHVRSGVSKITDRLKSSLVKNACDLRDKVESVAAAYLGAGNCDILAVKMDLPMCGRTARCSGRCKRNHGSRRRRRTDAVLASIKSHSSDHTGVPIDETSATFVRQIIPQNRQLGLFSLGNQIVALICAMSRCIMFRDVYERPPASWPVPALQTRSRPVDRTVGTASAAAAHFGRPAWQRRCTGPT